jgi:hypothetical protein
MTTVPAIVVSKVTEDAKRSAAGFLARYGGRRGEPTAATCGPGSPAAGTAVLRCLR